MNMQRKLTLVVATGAIALGAGHFVQKTIAGRSTETAEVRTPDVVSSSIETVAAGATTPIAIVEPAPVNPDGLQVAAVDPLGAQPAQEMILPAKPDFANIPDVQPAPIPTVVAVAATEDVATPNAAPQFVQPVVEECPISIELLPQPGAMVGVSVLAPCHPAERAVIRHAGLAVTGKTSAAGALFANVPAMTGIAEVEVAFASGDKNSETIEVPDFNGVRRFVVQWQDQDMFQLHAFENGADYDQPGAYSAANLQASATGATMTLLGDSSTELPLLAEVFTFAPDIPTEIVVEAAVTEETCGREIFAETIEAKDGSVEIGDITLEMPACDSLGDILVLKNLVEQTKVAAAD